MAEKAKAKKAKTLSKKVSASRGKKAEETKAKEELASQAALAKKARNTSKTTIRQTSQESDYDSQESNEFQEEEVIARPPLEEKFIQANEIKPVQQTIIQPNPNAAAPVDNAESLVLRLSRSLIRKIKEQAADEGIGLEEFAAELLSEGVVLRAFEIVERKNQMKGVSGNQMQANRGNGPSQNQGQNRNQGHRGQKGHRGMNHSRYQTIMEDKGAFLEYVRNQERNRR